MCFDTEWLAQVLGAGNGEEVDSCDYFWFVPVWWVGVGGWSPVGGLRLFELVTCPVLQRLIFRFQSSQF